MIEARGVEVEFVSGWIKKQRTEVLKGFSMTALDGVATGIIGANGAGKTTFFRACAGLCKPREGIILIDGINPAKEPEKARRLLAVMPEKPSIPQEWTGLDALKAAAAMRGIFGAAARSEIEKQVDRWKLEPFMNRLAAGYSRGQAVRVALGREGIGTPRNLILDEPTAGLDFESAASVRAWIAELTANGCCVIVATHIVSEIETICGQIFGLRDGVAWSSEDARKWVSDAAMQIGQEERK